MRFYHLGNYTDAIGYYDRALAIDPTVVFASYDKGNALEALENYSDAITYFDKALALDPNHVLAMIGKGLHLTNWEIIRKPFSIMTRLRRQIQDIFLT